MNLLKVNESWPVKMDGKAFSIECTKNIAKYVVVTFKGLPASLAPTITPAQDISPLKVDFGVNQYLLEAERNVRSWQAVLTSHILIEIDYDHMVSEFRPEDDEKIDISSFKLDRPVNRNYGFENYETFATAFLVLMHGTDFIEEISFYREGIKAQRAERYVDAYNNFYLYLETKFCDGKFKAKDVEKILSETNLFWNAFRLAIAKMQEASPEQLPSFFTQDGQALDDSGILKGLVKLRGTLRHHSLSNSQRWDPNNQRKFVTEVKFIKYLCFLLCHEEVTKPMFDTDIQQEFSKQAKENGMTSKIQIFVTYRLQEHIMDTTLDISVPQRTLDGLLAKFVLEKTFEKLSENEPAIEVIAIRANVGSRELFRYDLGPAILRTPS